MGVWNIAVPIIYTLQPSTPYSTFIVASGTTTLVQPTANTNVGLPVHIDLSVSYTKVHFNTGAYIRKLLIY